MDQEPDTIEDVKVVLPPAAKEGINKMAKAFEDAMAGKPKEPKPDAKPPEPTGDTLDGIIDPPKDKEPEPEKDPLEEFKDDKTANFKRAREVIAEKHAKVRELEKAISDLTAKASTPTAPPPPTGSTRPSWRARSTLACVLSDMSPISSRNRVPPSASRNLPF